MTGRALVFGASGMLGLHIVELLDREGWEIVAVVRPSSLDRRPWAENMLEGHAVVEADIRNPRLGELVAQYGRFDLAVNTVAVLSNSRAAYEVNAVAAGNAARAAARLSDHVVYVSAILSLGDTLEETTAEDAPCRPRSLFERSKCDGERLTREAVEAAGARWVIVRPVWITGEYSLNPDMPRLLRLASKLGVLPLLGGAGKTFQLVYAGDVAAAIYKLYEKGVDGVFNIAHPALLDMGWLAKTIGRAIGRKVRGVPIPAALVRPGVRFNPGLRYLVLKAKPVTVGKLEKLGWKPLVPPDEAVERLASWMAGTGLL